MFPLSISILAKYHVYIKIDSQYIYLYSKVGHFYLLLKTRGGINNKLLRTSSVSWIPYCFRSGSSIITFELQIVVKSIGSFGSIRPRSISRCSWRRDNGMYCLRRLKNLENSQS